LTARTQEMRNRWAHQKPISADDADRTVDTAHRLLKGIGATAEVAEIEVLRGNRSSGVNGLVRIGRSGLDGDYHEQPLDYEHTRKDGNDLVLKCYDQTGKIVYLKMNVDVIVEAAFGDVSPDHGMFA
jgi:hypothetical protein